MGDTGMWVAAAVVWSLILGNVVLQVVAWRIRKKAKK
jgi:hypothetical protein